MSDADREEWQEMHRENEKLRAERDALRAEVERLRRESVPMCVPTADGFRRVGGRRLLAAAQSLHRAWRRERAELALLRAFVRQLRSDGLDIDDPTTAPTWTGKIHVDGRLVFDLSTVGDPPSDGVLLAKLREVTAGLHASTGIPYSALCHYQDRPHCAGCPDDQRCEASGREPRQSAPPLCAWCGLPVETGKVMRVTRTDAAGVAHAFHWACWSAHVEQANGPAKEATP